MVDYIKNFRKIGGSVNISFLALITKEIRTSSLYFRMTYLCDMSYKIISKFISSRIKSLLPGIILNNQGGFVGNNQTMEIFISV